MQLITIPDAEWAMVEEAAHKFWDEIDLPLNFHPTATGARLLFTPIGAGRATAVVVRVRA